MRVEPLAPRRAFPWTMATAGCARRDPAVSLALRNPERGSARPIRPLREAGPPDHVWLWGEEAAMSRPRQQHPAGRAASPGTLPETLAAASLTVTFYK